MRPKVQCPSCNKTVRRRLSDQRLVWHRDPHGKRKWCVASPGHKGASPEAKQRFIAAQTEALRAEELTKSLFAQALAKLNEEIQGAL